MGNLNDESGGDSQVPSLSAGSFRHASLSARSPVSKHRAGPSPSPHAPHRHQRQVCHGRSGVLKILAVFIVVAGLAQLYGLGAGLRRTILSQCTATLGDAREHDARRGHRAALWEHLCAKESAGSRGPAATAVAFVQVLGQEVGTFSAANSGPNGDAAERKRSSKGNGISFISSGDAAGDAVYISEGRVFEAAAAVTAASSYHPAEWPWVYGGRAEPHKRILKRCTGSLFAPPLGQGSRPARGLVGVWLPQRFDLAFCDSDGSSITLRLRPAAPPAADTAAAPAAASDTAAAEAPTSEGISLSGGSVSSSSNDVDHGRSGGDDSGGRGGSLAGGWFWRRILPYWNGRTEEVSEQVTATAAAAVAGETDGGTESAHTIDLATSRALIADGGSIRIVWVDNSTLLADGVAAALELPEGAAPGPCGTRFGDLAAAAAVGAADDDDVGITCAVVGGPGATKRTDLWNADAAATSVGNGVKNGGGGGRVGSSRALLGEEGAKAEVAVAAAAAPTVVLATREDRMVLRLVEAGADVAAPARSAAALLRSTDTFTRQLETAVVSSYEALRTVPYAIGLPRSAAAEDKRLSRKLYDIMSVNTAPGWSTPDRTPHGWQWLWDSCFHALGLNLVNHTVAWEQLRGLLRCQRPDGFLPHICSRGGGPEDGGEQDLSGPASQLTQPPLLAWAVWDNYLFARDKRRLEWALPRIISLLEWLARHRSRDGGLTFFYVHGFESGMDNSPRFDSVGLAGRLSAAARAWMDDPRVGTCAMCAPHLLSVDLCALVAREMALVGKMLRELDREEEADRWANRSRAVADALFANAWNPDVRMYGDVVNGGGIISEMLLPLLGFQPRRRVSELVTVTGLLPLLAGRVPPAQLSGLLAHLKDPNSFATPVPLPSVAVSAMEGRARRRPSSLSASASSSSSSSTFSYPASTSASTSASASSSSGSSPSSPSLDMWRGPMWVNINYLVAAGLREQENCRECDRLASWIVRSTIVEVRKWYDGGLEDGDEDHPHPDPHLHPDAASDARGTVFEFYDPFGEVPPTRLSRKHLGGAGGVRDYHWTAALTLRMMAEEAARAAAAADAAAAGGGGHRREQLPEWVPRSHQ
ncbi:hypothetical protein VaNZ11_006363 [Volvox africanus]|uniref:Mannosylglycerate hydrolase MGH1-like glycoside hydrolase domain-containing protein n=1 Tax=Volvox africanus TaxID=51714 RepID=A0ABQ5S169_9CHLO|nr:hypothetical protein VaNZ11_006363 [Volvox africanus]